MILSGIYKIQSLVKPERTYIGSSSNIHKRWNSHLQLLRKGTHSNKRLQNHCNKYGYYDLQFSLLITCENDNLIQNEQFFIDSYNPWFNIRKIADRCTGCHWKLSEETKHKMSIAAMGHKKNVGQKRTPEFKKRQSERFKGRKKSQATIQKLITAGKSRKHPDEVKRKISESNKGRKISAKSRQRLLEYNKNRVFSNDTKNKISNSLKRHYALKHLSLVHQN
jgi:group I intron endonuclease